MITRENDDQTSAKDFKQITGLSPEFLAFFKDAVYAELGEEVK